MRHLPPDFAHLSLDRLDADFSPYHRVVADLAVRYTPATGKVIDIGAGLGHVLELVRAALPYASITAADIDERCLRRVSERILETKTILLNDPTPRRRELGTGYDTAILCHTLEHTRAPLEVLEEVTGSVRLGGHVILAVPNPVRPQVVAWSARKHHYVNRGHVYCWDPSHWRNFLENIAGLAVEEYAHDEVRIFPRRASAQWPTLGKIEAQLGRLFPWYTFSNIAVIRA